MRILSTVNIPCAMQVTTIKYRAQPAWLVASRSQTCGSTAGEGKLRDSWPSLASLGHGSRAPAVEPQTRVEQLVGQERSTVFTAERFTAANRHKIKCYFVNKNKKVSNWLQTWQLVVKNVSSICTTGCLQYAYLSDVRWTIEGLDNVTCWHTLIEHLFETYRTDRRPLTSCPGTQCPAGSKAWRYHLLRRTGTATRRDIAPGTRRTDCGHGTCTGCVRSPRPTAGSIYMQLGGICGMITAIHNEQQRGLFCSN